MNESTMHRQGYATPFALVVITVFITSSIPSASSLVCFYCSEHYLTCETYQRYQNCQPNEDRCYILQSSDQVMQGCGQSFLAYCNQPGVCHKGDLSNCFGRQCPLWAGSQKTAPSLFATVLALTTTAVTSLALHFSTWF